MGPCETETNEAENHGVAQGDPLLDSALAAAAAVATFLCPLQNPERAGAERSVRVQSAFVVAYIHSI